MNHTEFAAAIKAKYPQYADMSDADLTRAMMAKFPEYSDVDTSGMSAASQPAPTQQYGSISPAMAAHNAAIDAKRAIVSGAWNGARNAIAAPLALGEAGARMGLERIVPKAWLPALQQGMTADTSQYTPGQPATFGQAFETAWNGRKEGLRGMGDNPLNLVALAPGLAPARLADLATEAVPASLGMRAAAASPWGQMGLETGIGAIQGAGMGAIDATANPQNQSDPVSGAKWGGLIGGLGQGLAGSLQNYGASKFPGLSEAYNSKVTSGAKDLISENLPQILGPGILPKGREGFLKLAAKNQGRLGGVYDDATASVPKDWTYPTADLWQNSQTALENEMGRIGGSGLDLQPGSRTPVLPQHAQDMVDEGVRKVMANQIKNGSPEDVLTATQLAGHRKMLVNPKTYTNPQGAAPILQKDVGDAWHTGITGALMGAPNYAATLGEDVPQQYAMWKSLTRLATNPGNLGLAHRIPGGPAVSHWVLPSLLYKMGQGAGLASRLGAYQVNPGLFQGVPATADSSQNQ